MKVLEILESVTSRGSSSKIQVEKNLSESYGLFCKPALQKLLSILKLDISYVRAKHEYLYRMHNGNEVPVVDFLGGFGSTILGHNHPEVQNALKQCVEENTPVHAQVSIRSQTAHLAEKLNNIIQSESPIECPKKYIVHLTNTGTEASEAALKHALMKWNEGFRKCRIMLERAMMKGSVIPNLKEQLAAANQIQPVFLAIEGSFHGKTAGSLAVTSENSYSEMYPRPTVETVFLRRDSSPVEIMQIFEQYRLNLTPEISFSRIAGVIVEVVQGEGGIFVLSQEFLSALSQNCSLDKVPLIADEIQTGLFRTGKWIASHHFGIAPDYILLGKSLGGGIVKIAALLVREDQYLEKFSLTHSSTFAEDDLSSYVARRSIEILALEQAYIEKQALQFKNRLFQATRNWIEKFPGVIREVRGIGFMIGIEFDLRFETRSSHALDALRESGYMTYIFSSYLLHQHGVRVGATLNQSFTLRFEPSAFISQKSIDQCLTGVEELVKLVYQGRIFEVTAHLFSAPVDVVTLPVISPIPVYRGRVQKEPSNIGLRRVVFLSHVVNEDHLTKVDPYFKAMSRQRRIQFLNDYSSLGGSILLHEQVIAGANGEKVIFELRGICSDSRFFETSLRTGDSFALEKVRDAVTIARKRGASHIGLGQYTSIVSDNGLLISDQGAPVTTGNSLTVGLTWEAVQSLLKRRGQNLSDLHVGIVGVAGNICNVYAQIIGDYAYEMTVVHREPYPESSKFRKVVQDILDHSKITREKLHYSHELSSLQCCDLIIVGTNSTRQFILPEHLKKNALIVDVSVPSNLHPSVLKQRTDVEYVQGGFGKLPLGQKLDCPTLFAPEGETFACLAETLTVALSNYSGSYSLGHLNKKQVLNILQMSRDVGFELGSMKILSAY